jgi:DNA-binding IclR family transcriptional regulator
MKNIKNNILIVLKDHPEGLTTVDITKILKTTRNTASKYVYQLLVEGKIRQREVGTAKLCFINGEEHEGE